MVRTPLRSRTWESFASLLSSLDWRSSACAAGLVASSATSAAAATGRAARARRFLRSIVDEASRAASPARPLPGRCNRACDQPSGGARSTSRRPCGDLFLHLQGGVVDLEALVQEQLEPAAGEVAVGAGGDDDVGGERAEAGGHGPDVQVVDGAHALLRADRRAHRLDVEALGRRLHQDLDRLLDQPPGGGEDEDRDHQADDRVDDRRAAGEDEGAGDDDPQRAERVGEAVAKRALEVEVLAAAAGEDDGRRDVAGEAEQAERQDAGAVDRRRVAEAAERGERDRRSRRRRAAGRWRAPRAPPSAGSRRCGGRRPGARRGRRRRAPGRSSRRPRAGARRRRGPPASRSAGRRRPRRRASRR